MKKPLAEKFQTFGMMNDLANWNARQKQLISTSDVTSSNYSLTWLQMIYQRVDYFVNQIAFYNIKPSQKRLLRLILRYAVLNGKVAWIPSQYKLGIIITHKTKTTKLKIINLFDYDDFQNEEIEINNDEIIILYANSLSIGIFAKTNEYLPTSLEMVNDLTSQFYWLNKKLAVKLETNKAIEYDTDEQRLVAVQEWWNLQNFKKQPFIFLTNDLKFESFELPNVDITEYFKFIQNYLDFYDGIAGMKIANNFSDKTRDLQAQQNAQTYKNNVIFNEWFENVEYFVDEFNYYHGLNITISELVEEPNDVEKNEYDQSTGAMENEQLE